MVSDSGIHNRNCRTTSAATSGTQFPETAELTLLANGKNPVMWQAKACEIAWILEAFSFGLLYLEA